MGSRKVRWGIIGCGGIADRKTIPGMIEADNIEIVGVMDSNMAIAEKVRGKYGIKHAFDNYDDLLATEEIEAVYIASPVFCHKEQAIAAARAKKQILLEKPMALTSADAEEIKKVCCAEGVMLGVGFLMRFHAYHQKIKELIEIGTIGEIVSMRGQFTCWYPDIEGAWRQKKQLSGGGALMDMGIHVIDLLQYVSGLKVTEVAAFNETQTFGYEVDDSSAVAMKMNNGALCYVDSNFNIPDAASVAKLEIYGTRGSIVASGTLGQSETGEVTLLTGDDSLGYDANQKRRKKAASSAFKGLKTGNIYEKETERFSAAYLGGEKPPADADSAIYDQKVIEAAYKSSREKRFVTVEP